MQTIVQSLALITHINLGVAYPSVGLSIYDLINYIVILNTVTIKVSYTLIASAFNLVLPSTWG